MLPHSDARVVDIFMTDVMRFAATAEMSVMRSEDLASMYRQTAVNSGS
ncbi:hypothetical protein [Methylocaldum sp.]|nr:hypothetical protein [Methylocaldum sp.]HYE34366.1 hypothetical protein [Methylocaldum sp.]